MRAITALLVLSTSIQCGCQQSDRPAMKDIDRIQGEWALVGGERHGKTFAEETIKSVTLTFDGGVLKTAKADGITEATFTLHPETNPKGIDLDMDGNLGLGIYKLEEDTLTILHGEIEEPRPKDFEEIKGGTLTLLVLRKASP
jgi:uncharacterized protein (TIGR03067 family)